ncbi:hypothetical protein HMPREF1143_2088 [Peptoanaerobacter stomatis]|uniref:Uncharacterized protein n=1 Tax=Peptoanaerobacter stomatis TaxID=796937 RepID=J6HEG4_9FIRM|nr:hypothetical protein HMPREF1143_2088 [Peptoanaerobacter stomatis]
MILNIFYVCDFINDKAVKSMLLCYIKIYYIYFIVLGL